MRHLLVTGYISPCPDMTFVVDWKLKFIHSFTHQLIFPPLHLFSYLFTINRRVSYFPSNFFIRSYLFVCKLTIFFSAFVCSFTVSRKCSTVTLSLLSPWYNRDGWQGVKTPSYYINTYKCCLIWLLTRFLFGLILIIRLVQYAWQIFGLLHTISISVEILAGKWQGRRVWSWKSNPRCPLTSLTPYR